jgi:hypothetical protein
MRRRDNPATTDNGRSETMMMDMSGMSIGMMAGMGVIWLLLLAFVILGIAAFIKYLRS